MSRFALWAFAIFGGVVVPVVAFAYPGGTPNFQTDVAPFCASCHSSLDPQALAGTGERAEKELAESKHIAVVLSGQEGYASLTDADRETFVKQLRAIDEASTVAIEAPASIKAGEVFQVTVRVTGGAGPVVGVGLVDSDHRWYARPAASAGWLVVAPPAITDSEGQQNNAWIANRPLEAGRNLSFVNVTDIASDSAIEKWDHATVVFTLQAPAKPGSYPLAAVYFYGTEKSTLLGYKTSAMGQKKVRGGYGGGSGRVRFTDVSQIQVQ
jgi:hypothetical protein